MTDQAGKTALLVMDVQPGIVDRLEQKKDEYVNAVQRAANAAHSRQIPVVFVVVGFRPGMPEVGSKNKMFSALTSDPSMSKNLTDPTPAITPTGEDIVITKRRVSAFSGSDLEVILRAKNVSHLVLAGIATSGVVLSTVREAADKDYELTVLADLCWDQEREVHAVLIEKVFPKQADIMTSDEWANTAVDAANQGTIW